MIIITGASGGLGTHIIPTLKENFEIIGTYCSHKPETSDNKVSYHKLDVCNEKQVNDFVKKIYKRLDKVVFLSLVGISIDSLGHKMTEDTWVHVLNTNLKGAFLMSRALLPIMRQQEWGRIIYVSSIVGQMGIAGTCAYSASKAGLFGLTRTLAAENAAKNITVNTLSLGYFDVGMINVIKPDMREQIKEKIPMRRFGNHNALEAGIKFLIDCDYITGTIININGGMLY